ncbi:MAG: hypothetical protein WC312_03780 [Candidatus Omnitrophota bacterium]|jgi:hypothetical protein
MRKIIIILLFLPFLAGASDFVRRYPTDTPVAVITAEDDPLSWSTTGDQSSLSGTKSGTFNLDTSGTLGAGAITGTSFAIGSNTISDFGDLKAIEELAGTSGFLKKTAANTWALDTAAYEPSHSEYNLTGTTNQVNLSADGTGVLLGRNIVLSLPQNIHTSATPIFGYLNLITPGLSLISGGMRINDSSGSTVSDDFIVETDTQEFAFFIDSGDDTATFNIPLLLSNKITAYNNTNTAGVGIAYIVSNVSLAAQSAAISSTNFTNANVAGQYRISYYLVTTTADATAGTIALNIAYTDASQAQNIASPTINLATLGSKQQEVLYVQLASGNLAYSTTLTGAVNNARYNLYISVERLG